MLFVIKLLVIAIALGSSFLYWARPGITSGELSPLLALLGVLAATAIPVLLVHFAWLALFGKRGARNEPPPR